MFLICKILINFNVQSFIRQKEILWCSDAKTKCSKPILMIISFIISLLGKKLVTCSHGHGAVMACNFPSNLSNRRKPMRHDGLWGYERNYHQYSSIHTPAIYLVQSNCMDADQNVCLLSKTVPQIFDWVQIIWGLL